MIRTAALIALASVFSHSAFADDGARQDARYLGFDMATLISEAVTCGAEFDPVQFADHLSSVVGEYAPDAADAMAGVMDERVEFIDTWTSFQRQVVCSSVGEKIVAYDFLK